MMAQKILEHIFQPDTPMEESQNLEQAFSMPELPSSATQKDFSWPTLTKSPGTESTVLSQTTEMALTALEHIDRSVFDKEKPQEPGQVFSRLELPPSATSLMDGHDKNSDMTIPNDCKSGSLVDREMDTQAPEHSQKDFSLPTLTKSQETESTVLPQTTEMTQTALEHIDRSAFDKEKPQELGQAFPRLELPPSATSLMDGHDNNSDMTIPNDCKSGSLVDREMDTQAPKHSQKNFSLPTLTKSQETEPTVLPQTTEMAQTALEHIDRSVFDKEKPQELGQAFPRLELPPSATSLMDGHDRNSDMRIPNDCKSSSLVDREMDTQAPEHSQKLFLWPTSSKFQEFESTVDSKPSKMAHKALELIDRSLNSKGQLEELEIASSPPEPPPNSAAFLMDVQDERSDPRIYDGRSVSSNGRLEKLELNFLSKPPPNSATLTMDGRDERSGMITYDDRSVSSKGQLEGKELTFLLPNPPPNSATFLMNDQDEMPDPSSYDELKTWSFTGNEMDISDREDSEEVLSDISTSESEDLELHRPSKRARTSDSGFSGTFSMPPAWKLFAEPSLFPAYTFISRENWTLDGWPGRGQI